MDGRFQCDDCALVEASIIPSCVAFSPSSLAKPRNPPRGGDHEVRFMQQTLKRLWRRLVVVVCSLSAVQVVHIFNWAGQVRLQAADIFLHKPRIPERLPLS
jgi:hypothetical protein